GPHISGTPPLRRLVQWPDHRAAGTIVVQWPDRSYFRRECARFLGKTATLMTAVRWPDQSARLRRLVQQLDHSARRRFHMHTSPLDPARPRSSPPDGDPGAAPHRRPPGAGVSL